MVMAGSSAAQPSGPSMRLQLAMLVVEGDDTVGTDLTTKRNVKMAIQSAIPVLLALASGSEVLLVSRLSKGSSTNSMNPERRMKLSQYFYV
jgi:hypothetical protein